MTWLDLSLFFNWPFNWNKTEKLWMGVLRNFYCFNFHFVGATDRVAIDLKLRRAKNYFECFNNSWKFYLYRSQFNFGWQFYFLPKIFLTLRNSSKPPILCVILVSVCNVSWQNLPASHCILVRTQQITLITTESSCVLAFSHKRYASNDSKVAFCSPESMLDIVEMKTFSFISWA